MLVCPPHPGSNLYVEALTLVLGFEDGEFERNLGLDEVMRLGPHNGLVSSQKHCSLPTCIHRRGPVSTQQDGGCLQAKRHQNETYLAGVMILDF